MPAAWFGILYVRNTWSRKRTSKEMNWMKTGIGILIVIFSLVLPAQQVKAQSSTPVASKCQTRMVVSVPDFPEIPKVVPATGTPETPDKSSDATPVSSPTNDPSVPASDEVSVAVESVTISLAACISDGDTAAVSELTSAEFRGDLYGGGERLSVEEYVEIVNEAPPVPTRIISVSNVEFNGIRTVRADVTLVRGNQLLLEQWTFLFRDDTSVDGTPVAANQGLWRAHRIVPLGMPDLPGSAVIDVTLTEYVIRLNTDDVTESDVQLKGSNEGAEAHEILVLRIENGAEASDLLRSVDGSLPAGIAVVGQLTLLPGETGTMALVDLVPGQYTIVCLLPDIAGIPHLSFGQQATFEVSER